MIERLQIELQVDSEACSHSSSPYLEHEEFIKYCKANAVFTNAEALEAYEKKDLLYPCFRLLYPSELLRRRFKAILPDGNGQYCYRDAWKPLINLEEALQVSQSWPTKEFEKAMVEGHPLDQALASGVPFIGIPSSQKYIAWSRYNVVEGTYEGTRSKKSRAVHYYSTWKLILLDELNNAHTVSYNRATARKSRSWLRQDKLHVCSLNEFMPYLRNVSAFAYRQNLRQINYFENSLQTKAEWNEVLDKNQRLAQELFKDADYNKWIRFLRKLIELHEAYRKHLRLIIVAGHEKMYQLWSRKVYHL